MCLQKCMLKCNSMQYLYRNSAKIYFCPHLTSHTIHGIGILWCIYLLLDPIKFNPSWIGKYTKLIPWILHGHHQKKTPPKESRFALLVLRSSSPIIALGTQTSGGKTATALGPQTMKNEEMKETWFPWWWDRRYNKISPLRYKEFIDFAFNKGYDANFGKKCWEPFGVWGWG